MKNLFKRDDLSQELVELKSHRHQEDSVRDDTDKDIPVDPDNDPIKVKIRSPKIKIISEVSMNPSPKFNWLSFWTMIASIVIVVILIILVPGPFDEIGATIVLGAINFFVANYRK